MQVVKAVGGAGGSGGVDGANGKGGAEYRSLKQSERGRGGSRRRERVRGHEQEEWTTGNRRWTQKQRKGGERGEREKGLRSWEKIIMSAKK